MHVGSDAQTWFHPSPDEWKDPMAYISSISDTGKRYGMCKIVPPLGWNMPFVTDTEVRGSSVLACAPAVAPQRAAADPSLPSCSGSGSRPGSSG